MRAQTTARADRTVVALVLLAVLIVVSALWGGWLDRTIHFHLNAAPLYAEWRPRIAAGTLLALVVAVLVVACADLAETLPFRRLLLAAFVAACAWGVCLALVDGASGLTMGITGPHGNFASLDRVTEPGEFVRTFTERIEGYAVHVRSHPPGLMVALWWLERAGIGSTGVAALVIGAGGSIVVAALLAAREVAGEAFARRAAPFLVLAPAALWLVTTFDALYAAVAAWGIVLFCRATGARGGRSGVLAFVAGLVLGVSLFLSYGVVLLGLVPFAVAVSRRHWRSLGVAAIGVAGVVLVFGAYGFWWVDGLFATRAEYLKGIARIRPYSYFVLASLAAFAISVGPATVGGLARLRDRRAWLLVGAGLAAVAIADISGFSKGEAERIWLPFWPWVALAAAALPVSRRRWWLGAQAVIVIAMQTTLFIPW